MLSNKPGLYGARILHHLIVKRTSINFWEGGSKKESKAT